MWGWLEMVESWQEGGVFMCHEGIPGHPHQKEGEKLSLCGAFAALKDQPIDILANLAYIDDREPDPKFLEGY